MTVETLRKRSPEDRLAEVEQNLDQLEQRVETKTGQIIVTLTKLEILETELKKSFAEFRSRDWVELGKRLGKVEDQVQKANLALGAVNGAAQATKEVYKIVRLQILVLVAAFVILGGIVGLDLWIKLPGFEVSTTGTPTPSSPASP